MSNSRFVMDLNRPQYAPSAELFLSAVVGESFETSTPSGTKLRYLNKNPQSVQPTTGPQTREELQEFARSMTSHGVKVSNAASLPLAEAVVAATSGVPSAKGNTVPASPMSMGLALAQNARGVLGANNPPNLGRALEVMFAMGSPADNPESLASLWEKAAAARTRQDPLLAVIDRELLARRGTSVSAKPLDLGLASWWTGRFPDSPYGWMATAWTRLMRPEWLDRLPTRVWTDWATMILRTGIAFGYLAEMQWYTQLGRILLGGSGSLQPQLDHQVLLPWAPARLPVQSRNVKVEIRQAVARGTAMRTVLVKCEEKGALGSEDDLLALQADPDIVHQAELAMGHPEWTLSCKNTYETIIYALLQRGTTTDADYYGFLRPRGTRYSVVAPGTEWIAVVTSLACEEPGGETHIGEVMRSLSRLGVRPELQEVVRLLEVAGLATGSADADHGVRVRSAF